MNKQHLLHALEQVQPALARQGAIIYTIEQSTAFAFTRGKVVAYNDELSISHPVDGIDFEGAVQADELYKLLKKIEQDDITVTLKKNQLILQAGKTQAGVTLQNEITLPIKELLEVSDWHDLSEDHIPHLKFAMGACSKEMTRPVLTCIHVADKVIESSDSFRLVHAKVSKLLPIKEFLIPASSAAKVVRYQPTQIAESSGWVHYKTDTDTTISCRTFQDEYPNTASILKVEGVELRLPKTTKEILDRARVFAKRDNLLDESVNVNIKDKRMTITSKSDAGWFKESANIRYKDTPLSFRITPYLFEFILDETNVCTICENRAKFTGPDWTYVAMLREEMK